MIQEINRLIIRAYSSQIQLKKDKIIMNDKVIWFNKDKLIYRIEILNIYV